MFVENPGISIVAIDPGSTTGVAIWDKWDNRLYIDQIDAGRGRKVRLNVWPNKVESPRKVRALKQVAVETGVGRVGMTGDEAIEAMFGRGKASEMQVLDVVEVGVVTVLWDLIMAVGPGSVVIVEDFILGWGSDRVASAKRAGLSPVRITSRLHDRMIMNGAFNGDAWRDWDGFGAHGADKRGVKVSGRTGGIMNLLERLSDVEKWRLGEPRTETGVLWAGKGVKMIRRQPSERLWLPGGEKAVVAWMREQQLWKPGAPHGMDALMHMISWARGIGAGVQPPMNRIWSGGEHLKGTRQSSKAAFL